MYVCILKLSFISTSTVIFTADLYLFMWIQITV